MLKKSPHILVVHVPAEEGFIRLVPSFVEQAATGLGLDAEAAEEYALAAEEVMAYLTKVGAPGSTIEIRCFAGSHYVQADFTFPAENLGLRSFNMTASLHLDDEAGLEEMGLLIASRLADRFRISRRTNGNPELTLIKEFSYPEMVDDEVGELKSVCRFTLQEPDAAQIKWFLRLVHHSQPASAYPGDFLFPGKIVDMAKAEDYRLLVAVGPSGEIGGGIVWKYEGLKTIELFGPYIFHVQTPADMARELMDACISSVARTSAQVLINRMPTPALPDGYLEPLGTIGQTGADGVLQRVAASFREMHEDMGAVAWVHPELVDFLAEEYRRFFFPREIRAVAAEGEAGEAYSVLSAEMDRRLGKVTMRPIWPGADRLENLTNHLNMFEHEGLHSIFFEMDLGLAWQAEFTPELLRLGFSPQLILPHAGAGDLVIFELQGQVS